jgi:hypothetical protein
MCHFSVQHCMPITLFLSFENASLVSKVKVKSLCFNWAPRHEGVWGSEGIAPRILTTAINGGEWSASRPCRFYPQGKSPRYPLDRRLGGPQSRSGRGGEEKNSQPLPELEPSIIKPITQRYTIQLSWLLV